jgi:hypothetical protein
MSWKAATTIISSRNCATQTFKNISKSKGNFLRKKLLYSSNKYAAVSSLSQKRE